MISYRTLKGAGEDFPLRTLVKLISLDEPNFIRYMFASGVIKAAFQVSK